MDATEPRDFFDRARAAAVATLVASGVVAVVGTLLDWVTIEPPGRVPEAQADRLATFRGIETSDGKVIAGAGIALVVTALLLAARRRQLFAWIAFALAILIGAIAIADYRDLTGVFYDEMQRIGKPSPALGVLLDAAAGVAGLVGSLIGIAATPSRR